MATQQSEVLAGPGSPVPAYTANPIDEKFQGQHEEYEEKVQVRGDYSGAVAKTSPEEKKLVRKLDIWIMVGLNPIDIVEMSTDLYTPAHALADVLAQLP
jgi:hypothetical protein